MKVKPNTCSEGEYLAVLCAVLFLASIVTLIVVLALYCPAVLIVLGVLFLIWFCL